MGKYIWQRKESERWESHVGKVTQRAQDDITTTVSTSIHSNVIPCSLTATKSAANFPLTPLADRQPQSGLGPAFANEPPRVK